MPSNFESVDRPAHYALDGIERIDANVADMRIGQGNELVAIGRIGQDLLVTRHRGIKYDLTNG